MDIAGYTITRCIAQGGMAAAYLAEQKSLQRTVVLKVLDTRANTSETAQRRFLSEGRLLATLQHPHVITLYDIGAVGDYAYLSMEYVPGGDLKDRILTGPLPPLQALDILEQIARGLGAAHARGIVHRDVKPGNVLFRADGTVVLSDFGIAKSLAADGNVTSSGSFIGSPNYMAPEQAKPGEIDHRVDFYALGVIFHEMLTGRKPYVADSIVEVIHLHAQAPLPRLPPSLAVFQELLDLMIAKAPAQRFRDAAALLHYLSLVRTRWLAQDAQAGPGPSPWGEPRLIAPVPTLPPQERRWRLVLYLLLGVTLVAHGVLFFVGQQLTRDAALPVDPAEPGQVAAVTAALAAPPPKRARDDALEPASVLEAMRWLAAHSLAAGRLTAPPADCALYYYRRVLELAPQDAQAQDGVKQIALRYREWARLSADAGALEAARRWSALAHEVEALPLSR